jgi:cytochrome c oxidase subunit 2
MKNSCPEPDILSHGFVTLLSGSAFASTKGISVKDLRTRSALKKKLSLVGIGALTILVLSSCSGKTLGFQNHTSSVNDTSFSLWRWAWITAAVVGVFTAILILYPAFRHRRKDDTIPMQFQYNLPAEVAYTVIPFLIVAVLFYFTAKDESKITNAPNATNITHNIAVNAQQWSWQFTYDDVATKPTVTGTPQEIPTLVVPLGEEVRYTVTSSDVVHGFWIPAFMEQIEALPGVTNHLAFTANKLGTFPGRCNILCGRDHTYMLFKVEVVPPAQYKQYISSLKAA